MPRTIADLPKKEISLGEIITQRIQVVNATVTVEDTPLERGQVLVSEDGGATFVVPEEIPGNPATPATEANGILLGYLTETGQAGVLVTGEAVEKNLIGLTPELKISLFKNKIVLK
jgi:hypothetical protein